MVNRGRGTILREGGLRPNKESSNSPTGKGELVQGERSGHGRDVRYQEGMRPDKSEEKRGNPSPHSM